MRLSVSIFLMFLLSTFLYGQVVSWEPEFPTENDSITIYFYADQGNRALEGYNGTVYAHTGLITNLSEPGPDNPGGWRYEIQDAWGDNQQKLQLERISTNTYTFIISPSLLNFYLLSEGKSLEVDEIIEQIAFVFRNSEGTIAAKTAEDEDIFVPVFQPGITASITTPNLNSGTEGTIYFPVMINFDEQLTIRAAAAAIGTEAQSMSILLDNDELLSVDSSKIEYILDAQSYSPDAYKLSVIARDTSGISDTTGFYLVISGEPSEAALPGGVIEGINYISDNQVTLVLFAPEKENVYVIGDFSGWQVDADYFMHKTPDGDYFWLDLNGLMAGEEYGYQYLVDGAIRIADPYAEKILDPFNDPFIDQTTYPNLKAYPEGKTEHPVSVLQTAQEEYVWQSTGYERPAQEDLVIYELLVRDFIADHSYQTLIDTLGYFEKLGVNAIELMPVNEFEGNISWGYNPSFYFAPDKYYGTKEDLKRFIDACHERGIAVILDMVLNHSFGQSPMVRLYWDPAYPVFPSYISEEYQQYGTPAANNPWFNQRPTHPYNVGYDLNHESQATQKLVDRINRFWLEEYNVDGFRFDLTKGFTNKTTVEYYVENGEVNERDAGAGAKDDSRITLLKRMYNKIREVDETAYIILEHFADNSEEIELINTGMMIWGNLNYNYNEATMGWHNDTGTYGKSDFSWGYYGKRGWNKPNLVTYMESHDEERLMYKNLEYGNSSGDYNIQELNTALNRIKLAAAFFFTYPGPKMIWQFGELGYDFTIDYNGRTGPKPIKWDYYEDENRSRLFKTYAALIHMRMAHEVFRSPETTVLLDLLKEVKRIKLSHESMDAVIIGNFDVVNRNADPSFHNTGWWYDFFSGDSIEVSDVNASLNLKPGEFHIFTTQKLDTPEPGLVTGLDSDHPGEKVRPVRFELMQNYPNPFNPVTVIRYEVGTIGSSGMDVKAYDYTPPHINLTIYNLLGEKVVTLVSERQRPGIYQIQWDATGLPSGIYLYRLSTAEGFSETKKLIIMK